MLPNLEHLSRQDDFWWMMLAVILVLAIFAYCVVKPEWKTLLKGIWKWIQLLFVEPFRYLAASVMAIFGLSQEEGPAPATANVFLDRIVLLGRGILLVMAAISIVYGSRSVYKATLGDSGERRAEIRRYTNMLESCQNRLKEEQAEVERNKQELNSLTDPSMFWRKSSLQSQIESANFRLKSLDGEVREYQESLKKAQESSWDFKSGWQVLKSVAMDFFLWMWVAIFCLEWTVMVNGISKDVKALRKAKEGQ